MNNYFMETHHHEWILTNKLGGYALGTGNLINQRKYHGLLISSDNNFQRCHLVAGIEEKVEWRGEYLHLDSNNYSNCIFPEGFLYLVKPWLRPYPIFLYSALPHQDEILIKKEIFMDADSNTVLIKYTNLGHHKLHFEFYPKFTMINHHEVNAPGSLDWEAFETNIEETDSSTFYSACRSSNGLRIHAAISKGSVFANRFSYYNVFYPWEVMKGYPGIGDQVALFELRFDLNVGEANYLLFSDKPIDSVDEMINRITKRYADLPLPSDYPASPDMDYTLLSSLDFNDGFSFDYNGYLKLLEFSLKDFLANDDIVAGYPWYGARGRDTMFVLNALLHSEDSLDLVERILRKYQAHLKDGLIPSLLPETGKGIKYESLDATLWYIILLYKLAKRRTSELACPKDSNNSIVFWQEVINLSQYIINSIISNKTYPFTLREDGLISLLDSWSGSTWMDANVDGCPVTPRSGAAVEINALWYNAICCYEDMCARHNALAKNPIILDENIMQYKAKVFTAFEKFWVDDYLADRLVDDEPVREFRPNSLLAVSLPWLMLSSSQMELLFSKAFKELYTFYGIRSLSPHDVKFKKKYYGNQRERDLALHNGSTWAWLLGGFCGLYLKLNHSRKQSDEIIKDLSNFVSTFRNSFMKGHIASIAEIWDGDSPHFPKGSPAMAWSVAALYNIESYIASLQDSMTSVHTCLKENTPSCQTKSEVNK